MNVIKSAAPVVLMQRLNLWRMVWVADTRHMVPFTQQILWLRQASAEVVVRHAGVDVCTSSSWHDCGYGYMSSVDTALDEARKLAKRLKVASSDKLTIEVDVTIHDVPVIDDYRREGREFNRSAGRRKAYLAVPPGGCDDGPWYTSDQPERIIVDGHEEDGVWPQLEPVELISSRAVFSTKHSGPGCNPAAAENWIRDMREIAEKSRKEAERNGTV